MLLSVWECVGVWVSVYACVPVYVCVITLLALATDTNQETFITAIVLFATSIFTDYAKKVTIKCYLSLYGAHSHLTVITCFTSL